jgi:hypothetical protein
LDARANETWDLANASYLAEWMEMMRPNRLLKGKGKGFGRFAGTGKGSVAGKGQPKGSGTQTNCKCCGNWGHAKRDCMHLAKQCHTCGQKGHLAHVCTKEVERPPKDPLSRTPGAAPATYAAAVTMGKSRICTTCDHFMMSDMKCCQRPGCKGTGKAAGKSNNRDQKPAANPAPTSKGGPSAVADGDPLLLEQKIERCRQMILEGKSVGWDMTSLEEALKSMLKEVPPPQTQYTEALAAKGIATSRCNILRQRDFYQKKIQEGDAEAQVRFAGFRTKRLLAISEQEEYHKAMLQKIDKDYETLDTDAKKVHQELAAKLKEKMDRHQADLDSIDAEAAQCASEAGELPEEAQADRMDEFAEEKPWPADIDARGAKEMEACLIVVRERIVRERLLAQQEREDKDAIMSDGKPNSRDRSGSDEEPDPKRAAS